MMRLIGRTPSRCRRSRWNRAAECRALLKETRLSCIPSPAVTLPRYVLASGAQIGRNQPKSGVVRRIQERTLMQQRCDRPARDWSHGAAAFHPAHHHIIPGYSGVTAVTDIRPTSCDIRRMRIALTRHGSVERTARRTP
jgi:hypothetical protein